MLTAGMARHGFTICVDFRVFRVSVNSLYPMKVPHIKEIVASVTLLVMIALGGVAVSLAQDSSPIAFSHSFALHHSSAGNRLSMLPGEALCAGIVPDAGDLTISGPRPPKAQTFLYSASDVCKLFANSAGVKTRKVPLHLLDSILLI